MLCGKTKGELLIVHRLPLYIIKFILSNLASFLFSIGNIMTMFLVSLFKISFLEV